MFYQWQRTFFENGAAAFSSPRTETKSSASERKIESLESKLKRKDEVIAEMGMEAPKDDDLSARRQEILGKLSRGEINVQEATKLLSQLKGDRS